MNKAVHTGVQDYLFTSFFVDWKYGEDKTKQKQKKQKQPEEEPLRIYDLWKKNV